MTSHDPAPARPVCHARQDRHLPGREGAQVLTDDRSTRSQQRRKNQGERAHPGVAWTPHTTTKDAGTMAVGRLIPGF